MKWACGRAPSRHSAVRLVADTNTSPQHNPLDIAFQGLLSDTMQATDIMEETEEERAERELKKRKRLSDAAGKALKKIAEEERHATITDLPDELFNRNILEYLDLESIKSLNMDETLDEVFNLSDYWCMEHDCFKMDNGALKQIELGNIIDADGLDAFQFFERLGYRNYGDWVDEESHPEKEVLLDFDPLYRRYLPMARKCPRCEIHAMKLVMEGMPQVEDYPKCGRCLSKFKCKRFITAVCSDPECEKKICNRCRKRTCRICNGAFCKLCSYHCDMCQFSMCLNCSDARNDARWIRQCRCCNFEACFEECDPRCAVLFDCGVCEDVFCHDCRPSMRCRCGGDSCRQPYCRRCVTAVACDDCGRTFRQDHAQNCNECGGTLSPMNQE